MQIFLLTFALLYPFLPFLCFFLTFYPLFLNILAFFMVFNRCSLYVVAFSFAFDHRVFLFSYQLPPLLSIWLLLTFTRFFIQTHLDVAYKNYPTIIKGKGLRLLSFGHEKAPQIFLICDAAICIKGRYFFITPLLLAIHFLCSHTPYQLPLKR